MHTFTEDEMVRLELLGYPMAEGLHPVELKWRKLSLKLFEDVKELEAALKKHHGRVPENGVCFDCRLSGTKRTFPEPFKQS